jgi:hypothetical protein
VFNAGELENIWSITSRLLNNYLVKSEKREPIYELGPPLGVVGL